MPTGQLVDLHEHVEDGATSTDGNTFAVGGKFGILLSSSKCELLWENDNQGRAFSVAFSPDGKRALSGHYNGKIHLWDAATGELLRTFDGHKDRVNSLAFSPDGARVISGSSDGIKLFNVQNGRLLATLIAGEQDWMTITPAGFFVSSRRDLDMLSIVRDFEVTSVVQIVDHLYRPDLVEQSLKGDPELKYEGASQSLNLERILDSGPAPQIETVPGRKTEREGDLIKLSARAVDVGGGMGEKVVWRVNGAKVGLRPLLPQVPPMVMAAIVTSKPI